MWIWIKYCAQCRTQREKRQPVITITSTCLLDLFQWNKSVSIFCVRSFSHSNVFAFYLILFFMHLRLVVREMINGVGLFVAFVCRNFSLWWRSHCSWHALVTNKVNGKLAASIESEIYSSPFIATINRFIALWNWRLHNINEPIKILLRVKKTQCSKGNDQKSAKKERNIKEWPMLLFCCRNRKTNVKVMLFSWTAAWR